ncbi:MAG: glycosyltransferase family 4 protein [Rhodospirillales bacterium]|nr:glycosyltransferase family 4 protein [Rhodospirillales bacterium]
MTTDAVGGVWRYTLELARGFVRHRAIPVVAVLGPAPTTAQRAEAAAIPGLRLVETGLPLDWTAETPEALDATAHALAQLAATQGVDSVQVHAPALVGVATWPVPVLAVVHSCVATWWRAVRGGALPADLAWRAAATARGIARADAVVAPSAAFAAALQDTYRPGRSIGVIHNGRRPVPATAARECAVLTAGRLWDEGKSVATLDAAALLVPWKVCAAGPLHGPNRAAIHLHRIEALGELDEAALATAYAEATVFASTARYEPFGLAVLEAAQAGCALVLSDIPTFRELWEDAAFFVPAGDPDALAATLRGVLADPALAARAGQRARARAVRYTAERMADETWAVHAAFPHRRAA